MAVAFIDTLFKYLALTLLPLNTPLFHFWLLDLMLFQNRGIAFSLPLPGTISILISIGLIGYFARSYAVAHARAIKIAALCIVLGALSNLSDRIFHGFVIDYLLFFGRSAINLADILILTGLFLHVKYNASIN